MAKGWWFYYCPLAIFLYFLICCLSGIYGNSGNAQSTLMISTDDKSIANEERFNGKEEKISFDSTAIFEGIGK